MDRKLNPVMPDFSSKKIIFETNEAQNIPNEGKKQMKNKK